MLIGSGEHASTGDALDPDHQDPVGPFVAHARILGSHASLPTIVAANGTDMLIARAFSAFTTRLYRHDGEQIGALTVAPWLGAPRNGRLRGSGDDVARLELGGRTYRLEWEIVHEPAGRRGVRWFLVHGGDALATGSARHGERGHRWEVDVSGERYALVTRARWFRLRVDLLSDGARIGEVRETTRMFSLARTYEVTCPPAFDAPLQAFLVHLVTGTTR